MRVINYGVVFLLAVTLAGCASMKEGIKCVRGVSTKVLEDGRKEAIKKTFDFDYATCDSKVREILKKAGVYIYADDKTEKLIAIYTSASDTTPVGIFFEVMGSNSTQVEISSPSTDAKEQLSKRIFNFLEGKPEAIEEEKGNSDAKGLLGDK